VNWNRICSALLAMLWVGMSAGRCLAQDRQVWNLTDAAMRQRAVSLTAIDADGALVSDPSGTGASQSVPWDDLVMLGRSAAPAAAGGSAFTAGLWSGDRFMGKPQSFSGQTLVWDSPLLGSVKIPLSQLAFVIRSGQTAPPDDPRDQDIVQLANGDTAAGIVTSLDANAVSVQSTGDPVPVPLSSVRAILLTTPHRKSGAEKRGIRVTIDDGSIATASSVKLTGATFAISLSDGQSASLPLKSVVSIEQINGPISWLCERAPSEDVQTPFWGSDPTWPTRIGASVDGRPLVFGTRAYPHGIGVHAYSRLSYVLDGSYAAIRLGYAITGESPLADLTVRIKLDGKTAYEAVHVRSSAVVEGLVVDLRGARTLTMEVDYGPAGDVQGRMAWLDPVLMKTMPPVKPVNDTEPAPATQNSDQPTTVPDGAIAPPATAPVVPPGIVSQPD